MNGVDANWSNAAGGMWLHNNVAAPAGDYPGMFGNLNADVYFLAGGLGSATLDVGLAHNLRTLHIEEWNNTLTANFSITVSGAAGSFKLLDGSTIDLKNTADLFLSELATNQVVGNVWSNGKITGTSDSELWVSGSTLHVKADANGIGSPELGAQTIVVKTTNNLGRLSLYEMTDNMKLVGADNFIDVRDGGTLELGQEIADNDHRNLRGGITTAGARLSSKSIQINVGGTLLRGGSPTTGVADEVVVEGPIYNLGGTFKIDAGNLLKIDGADSNGYSYWQKTEESAKLDIRNGGRIDTTGSLQTGKVQIDIGEVKFEATSGGSSEFIRSAGLIFGNANDTTFKITNSTAGTPGTVVIEGGLTLGTKTTTTMNFHGANNTADKIEVRNGALTLKGKLSLLSHDNQKPSQALDFFANFGTAPSILGAFDSITDNVGGTDSGQIINQNAQLKYYRITIQ